ncbi:alpha-2-macroglobulin [Sessilibacter sp. MAH4]
MKTPLMLFKFVFGSIQWQAPIWLVYFNRQARSKPWLLALLLILLVAVIGYFFYLKSLPGQVFVKANVEPPFLTEDYQGASASGLQVYFEFDYSELKEGQILPEQSPSIARLDLIGEELTQGVTIAPVIEGQWQWGQDQVLYFSPEGDWAPGTEYTIDLDPAIFSEETRLKTTQISFTTPAMQVSIDDISFYQDPTNSSIRRVTADLNFTHPVDPKSFEQHAKLLMRPSGAGIEVKPKAFSFDVNYSETFRTAYVVSEPIDLPDVANTMTLNLDKGIASKLGGAPTDSVVDNRVLIPDVASYLKISEMFFDIVRNDQDEPEQAVFIELTDDIEQENLAEKLEFYLLPDRWNNRNAHWNNGGEINDAILEQSEKLSPKWLENPRSYSATYSFVFDVPENRQIYARIHKGLISRNGFKTTVAYDHVVTVNRYPQELQFFGEGSILTYSGEHKLSVSARGVQALKFSIGQIIDGQLTHLISQTSGDIRSPDFNNWYFDENNIAKINEKIVRLNNAHPKTLSYASLDLSSYLKDSGQSYGLFYVKVHGYDERRKNTIYGIEDHRLILVTDLGIIVKSNINNTQDVFVQSIVDGKPVANAKVQLLGKNGLPVVEGTTNDSGHTQLASTEGLSNEKQPVVYFVTHGNDSSFIPFDRYSRQINNSRFDVGGINPRYQKSEQLNAFVFTDRGIYRPGESVHLGFIVKRNNLQNVEGIPVEVQILDSQYRSLTKQKITVPKSGFFEFNFDTKETFNTGLYTAQVYVLRNNNRRGEELGNVTFTVEEFQPDTMKITSELEGLDMARWTTQSSITAKATLKNLFDVPAQNRRTEAYLHVYPASFYFSQFKDYTFSTITSDKEPLNISETLPSITTNNDGEALYDIDLSRFSSGTYRVNLSIEGFDQAGGRSVTTNSSVLLSPLDFVLGYKTNGRLDYINQNSQRSIEWIALDAQLNTVQQQDLTLRTIELQDVSTLVKQPNGTYQYQTITKENILSNKAFVVDDNTSLAIDSSQPGRYAYEVYDNDNHRLSRIDFTVVGVGNLSGKIDKNAELQLTLNKNDYKPGETIEMSIQAPYQGAGLITIESDRVHIYKWFKTTTQSTLQTIRVPDNLEGTAYVNVAFVRDISSEEIYTSPLSYAVQPFSVDRSKRDLAVNLDIDRIVRPGKTMDIRYSTEKPAKIVVFAVDEGILQVENYQTPQPLSHFLQKRALGVTTMQMMDLILPEFNLWKNLSAAGGGAFVEADEFLAANLNPFTRKTDTPAVYWSGIIESTSDVQTVQFNVPDTFAGALRVMAVAVSDEAMGATSKSTIVRGPFVLTPNVLLQTAPGDEFEATIGIANIIEGSGVAAQVKVSVETSEHLELLSESTQTIAIDEGGEAALRFKFKTLPKLGAANIVFSAEHNGIDASRSASLSVRPVTTYRSDFSAGFNKNGDVTVELSRQLFEPLASQHISASTSPLVLVDGLHDYLENYPHGCTEQVVSQVFPRIGLMSHIGWQDQQAQLQEHFDQVLLKLRQRQLSEGGFSFWPGNSSVSEYPTVYAAHFLLEAKELGFAVPNDILERLESYLTFYVGQQSSDLEQARVRANAIYLLTRMGKVTTNYLVELQEYLEKNYAKTWRKDLTASYMAATYLLLKQNDQAEQLIDSYVVAASNNNIYGDFDSALTQNAQHIYLLARHFELKAKALNFSVISEFINPIFEGRYNTIAASYSVLALSAYASVTENAEVDAAIEFMAQSNSGQQVLTRESAPFAQANYDTDTTAITVKGEDGLYYVNVQTGFDHQSPTSAVKEGVEVTRTFYDKTGKAIDTIKQGAELDVVIRVRALNNKTLSNIAVIDLLPGGFEVVRNSINNAQTYNSDLAFNNIDYVDVREDRVVYYGRFNSAITELKYKVKATAAGTFTVPSTTAESMYDRSVKAISESRNFKVLAAQP